MTCNATGDYRYCRRFCLGNREAWICPINYPPNLGMHGATWDGTYLLCALWGT